MLFLNNSLIMKFGVQKNVNHGQGVVENQFIKKILFIWYLGRQIGGMSDARLAPL